MAFSIRAMKYFSGGLNRYPITSISSVGLAIQSLMTSTILRLFLLVVLASILSEPLTAQERPMPSKTHRTFGLECASCHTTESWTKLRESISFDHKLTGYALVGLHSSVSCASCHAGVSFKELTSACAACHEDQHKGQFGDRCQECHTPAGWRTPSEQVAKHQLTRFPLLGAHELLDCSSCHVNQQEKEFINTPTDCYACHRDDFERTTEPNHALANFDHTCQNCHTMATLSWKGSFVHPSIPFMQSAAHVSLECGQCHGSGYKATPTDCYGCHMDDFAAVIAPNHVTGQFDHNCTVCHDPVKWKPAAFNHELTSFPLRGKHATTPCSECHASGRYSSLPTDCWSCHQKDYTATTFPNHVQGQFDHRCDGCHTLDAWKPAAFNHDQTNFRLTGAHLRTECQMCHVGGRYTGLSLDCQGCHNANYQQTTRPNHQLVGFTKFCEDCHNTNAWQPVERIPSSIDHDKTRFPLLGKHLQTPCEDCHVNKVFGGTLSRCFDCHEKNYRAAMNPDHVSGIFSQDCLACHSMEGWKPASFDHSATAFPLSGKHTTATCEACHVAGNYQLKYTGCFSCHEPDFNRTLNPNHVSGQFPQDCSSCHSVDSWIPATLDHAKTRFPLQGAHNAVPCGDCHTNGRYVNLPMDCFSCHQKDFDGAKLPDHASGGFSHDCTTCHSPNAWKPATFDHALTRFPLLGKHTVVRCEECHINGKYTNMQTDCWDCHRQDYEQVALPSHTQGQFPNDCRTCHSADGWKPSSFSHEATRFPLHGAHRSLDCQQCHVGGKYSSMPSDCWSCHEAKYRNVATPDHVAGKFNQDCTICHNDAAWKPTNLDHSKTRFPLTGLHQNVACEQCHINGQYGVTLPTNCYDCHQTDFNRVTNPDHRTAQLPHDCTRCHTTAGWKPATFDHAATAFPLSGAHLTVACGDCHLNGNYQLKYTNCLQCHQTDFDRTTNPDHNASQFNPNCLDCHTTTAWKPSTFDHAATKFPLQGAHAVQPCQACHVSGNYNLKYTDCYQCHQQDFVTASAPDHVLGNFVHDCTTCHTVSAWKPSTFDHAATKFPLQGAHANQPCQSCHIAGNYNLTYSDCYQCHQQDFTRAIAPDHVKGSFTHDCTTCHTVLTWKPSTFDHAATNFPLEGAHTTPSCERCHVNGNYSLKFTDCYQCHQAEYTGVQNPNHVTGNFSRNCSVCHTSNAWKPSQLDHNKTNFPLTGRHAIAPCEQCHIGGNYSITYSDCKQCHEADFNLAKTPDHAAGKFDSHCEQCHTTSAWKPSTFSHTATAFPLVGAHGSLPCQDCHVNGNYTLRYTDCWQCHEQTYTSAQNPNHVSAQISRLCLDCHTQSSWRPSTFQHAATRFPLTGGHAPLACEQCHVNGNYSLQYQDCWQCHESTFNQTTNPNHAQWNMSHNCLDCHTENGWRPATFNHDGTAFPLQGAHTTPPCSACHISGNYQLRYNDCFQCHQSQFNSAVNPNHVSNQFPHTCLTCHTQTAWTPSTFDHASTQFPLTGAHAAQPCIECHTSGNYNLIYTDCWQCHSADFNSTTNPSHSTNQFSHDCTQCHSLTAWSPATFNHSNTNFPLQGAHVGKPCTACHINGNYNLTYSVCYQCHQTKYSSATTPANHTALSLNHDCAVCHTQTVWNPATPFRTSHNVNAPVGFPIYGSAKHKYPDKWNNCSECHTSNNTATFSCIGCHSNQTSLANEHQSVSGYQFHPTICANSGCHPDGKEP